MLPPLRIAGRIGLGVVSPVERNGCRRERGAEGRRRVRRRVDRCRVNRGRTADAAVVRRHFDRDRVSGIAVAGLREVECIGEGC